MANKDPKNVKRFIENISKKVYEKAYEGGGTEGGTVVVNELPETGEPHTIYELKETSKGSYNWAAYNSDDFGYYPPFVTTNGKLFVFDTYEQMVKELEHITIENKERYVVSYTRLDDMLYDCRYKNRWSFIPYDRQSEYEHYVFVIPNGELMRSQYILKSFDGYDSEGHGLGTLPDDTKVTLYDDISCFVLRQVTFDLMDAFWGISLGTFPSVSELPTVEDGHCTSDIINGSTIVTFNGKIKYSLDRTRNYYFDYDDYSFRVPGEWEADAPLYTGELEWTEEIPDNVKEYLFEEYPYESIINETILDKEDYWLFQPSKGGEIISTYWIYTNNEWFNVDEIKKEPQSNVVYGQLTKSSTFDEDYTLDCSLTNDEIISYIDAGKLVVLNFNDEIDAQMYNYFGGITGYNLESPLHFDINNMRIPNSSYADYLIEFNGEKFYLLAVEE